MSSSNRDNNNNNNKCLLPTVTTTTTTMSSSNRDNNNSNNSNNSKISQISESETLQQKVKQLEQQLNKAQQECILLKSLNDKLQNTLNVQRCVRYQPKISPPNEIDPKRPITIIANAIFNVHVSRIREDLENWSSKSFNYTNSWNHNELMELWSIYKWDCKLANIPQAQQMKLKFTKSNKPDKYRMELVLSSNCLTGSYGYCSQPAEAVSYQPKLGKIYEYTHHIFIFFFFFTFCSLLF